MPNAAGGLSEKGRSGRSAGAFSAAGARAAAKKGGGFGKTEKGCYFCTIGRMAEWSIAAVLKTVELHGSGGSNPSPSASALQ